MAKFIYQHPTPCAATLRTAEKEIDVLMHNGQEYDLPEENEFVASLVRQKRLTAVTATKTPKK